MWRLPIQNKRSCLLLKKEEIRPNIWPEILYDLSLWRRPTYKTLLKALYISSATTQVAPDLLKALAILSDTTVRRSAVDREDLKPHWKLEKKPHFSKWSTILLFTSFSKIPSTAGTTKCGKKSCELCANIFKTNSFTSIVTGKTYKINHKPNCDDNCLIYLSSCKCCGKQFVGEASDSLRYIWNNYKVNDRNHSRKDNCMQEHLFKHFNSMGHNGFLNKFSITFLNTTDG